LLSQNLFNLHFSKGLAVSGFLVVADFGLVFDDHDFLGPALAYKRGLDCDAGHNGVADPQIFAVVSGNQQDFVKNNLAAFIGRKFFDFDF